MNRKILLFGFLVAIMMLSMPMITSFNVEKTYDTNTEITPSRIFKVFYGTAEFSNTKTPLVVFSGLDSQMGLEQGFGFFGHWFLIVPNLNVDSTVTIKVFSPSSLVFGKKTVEVNSRIFQKVPCIEIPIESD